MPIYGYNCKSCEHSFDALQKMSDPKLVDCPECDEPSLRKLLSAPKFRLKGKGWYETDFKTGDKRNIAGDSDKKSASKSKDSDKTVKKTETKKSTPDTKAKSA
jgi:putative FmdB family regulatory protein